jgi:hypothetical protein
MFINVRLNCKSLSDVSPMPVVRQKRIAGLIRSGPVETDSPVNSGSRRGVIRGIDPRAQDVVNPILRPSCRILVPARQLFHRAILAEPPIGRAETDSQQEIRGLRGVLAVRSTQFMSVITLVV